MSPNQERIKPVAISVFHNPASAREAIIELLDDGFEADEIGVLSYSGDGTIQVEDVADDAGDRDRTSDHTNAGTAAAIGAATGAGSGALWALGIAVGLLPAIGPVIAGGLLGAVVASAATGATAGGLIGALIGLGIQDADARYYADEVKRGRTIVVVETESRLHEALACMRRHRGYDRVTPPDGPVPFQTGPEQPQARW